MGISDLKLGPQQYLKHRHMVALIQGIVAAAAKRKRSRTPAFLGYMTTRRIVKGQRYLRDHGLPHSAGVAAIRIKGD
ncbi:MAG: hypothetical protein M3O30_17460 [Planctomycetota bacterium]|nr:hypothetical protein [Planctomycetota bacterium]